MKDYKQMAENVFERREKYNAEKKTAIGRLKKGMTALGCLITVIGIALIHTNRVTPTLPDGLKTAQKDDGMGELTGPLSLQHIEQTDVVWMPAKEVIENDESEYMGFYEPMFLSWQGGFFGVADITEEDRFALFGEEIWFSHENRHTAYQVQDRPDCFAICINGRLLVYQKLFDVTFEVGGVTYGIQYSPWSNADFIAGDEVSAEEGFTVYEAVRLYGEADGREYLVNIMPLLKEHLPNFFGDDENYRDAWQIAVPLSEL